MEVMQKNFRREAMNHAPGSLDSLKTSGGLHSADSPDFSMKTP